MQNLLRLEEALFGYVGPLGAIKIRGLPGSLRWRKENKNKNHHLLKQNFF